ncbi:hypothetical protein AYJ54_16820 [Bradyrhizobium centrolobii]|uniref:Uncharacterized protein n=1 Tax=Bradyrhizobium centrolobii TaxID=1505087 RepID=A0A176YL64_9BRAD|nr:hypothetical protein AYJ54_16820 [Bradyrhizobium centrolobii]
MLRRGEFAVKELGQYLANDSRHPSATAIAGQCPIVINMLACVFEHWKAESWSFAQDFFRTGALLCEKLLAELLESFPLKIIFPTVMGIKRRATDARGSAYVLDGDCLVVLGVDQRHQSFVQLSLRPDNAAID